MSNISKTIVLPNGMSVSSVAYDGRFFYAVDGHNPYIFIFDRNGIFKTRINAQRNYTVLSYDSSRNMFFALTYCNRRVYILNCRLEEVGSLDLDLHSSGDSKANDINANGDLLEVTHPKNIAAYDLTGTYIAEILPGALDKTFLHYISLEDGYALHYSEFGEDYVKVNSNTARVPSCARFKGFILCGCVLYGVITYKYLYTYISPIYCDGVFNDSIFNNINLVTENQDNRCCN